MLDGTKDPDLRSRAQITMARALVRLGRSGEAERTLADLTRDANKHPAGYHDALYLLGEIRISEGHVDDALASWRLIVSDSTRAPLQVRQDALLELGVACERLGDDKGALDAYLRASGVRGTRTGEALFHAGAASERGGDLARAGTFYTRAAADSSGRMDRRSILVGAFKAARWTRDHGSALALADEFAAAYPKDPRTPRILFEAATAVLEAGDLRKAADLASAVHRRFGTAPQVDDALMVEAEALRKLGDERTAIELYESLEHKYPSSEHVAASRKAAWELRTYATADREAGLQKLAMLVGDVIAQQSRGTLSYRLAEISFHELRDYRLASDQYAAAVRQDLDSSLRPAALYFCARALELDAWKPGENRDRASDAKIAAAFDTVVSVAPNGAHAPEARQGSFLHQLRAVERQGAYAALVDSVTGGHVSFSDPAAVLLEAGRIAWQRGDTGRTRSAWLRAARTASSDDERGNALFGLAQVLQSVGSRDSAMTLLQELVRTLPNHSRTAEALSLLAASARERGDADAALAACDQLERRFFYTRFAEDLLRKRSEACLAAQRYADAARWAQRALDVLTADDFAPVPAFATADLVFTLAACAEKAGDRVSAKRWYGSYLRTDRTSERAGRALYALASIARIDNEPDAAERYLREAVRIGGPGTAGVMALETADLFFHNEKYSDAIAAYAELLKGALPDSVKRLAQVRTIVAYYRSDNATEADRRAAVYVKANPGAYNEAATFEFERGRYALRRNDIPLSRTRLRNVALRYPNAPVVPEAVYWLGRSFELDQNPQAAVALYDSLLRTLPDDPIAPRMRLALGNDYYTLEQWEKAAAEFRAILDHEDRSPDLVPFAMNNLILTYKQMEVFDGAMELTRKYIDRFPNDPDLIDKRIDIGVLYQKLGYYDQSIVHLQSLLESATPDLEAELRYYIGEAYFSRGDYQQAILEFLKVPYLVTRRGKMDWISTSYYMAGQSYEKMTKYEQAVTMYKQIIDRKDTDAQFKTAAQKEIDRVRRLIGTAK